MHFLSMFRLVSLLSVISDFFFSFFSNRSLHFEPTSEFMRKEMETVKDTEIKRYTKSFV